MPIHFDINMNPDGWAVKSLGTIMMMPLINLGMLITMLLCAIAIVKAKLQINTQNPALSFAQHRVYRRLMGHGMGILTLGMNIGFVLLGFMTSFPEQFLGKISFGFVMTIILLPCVPLIITPIYTGQGGCNLKPVITEADTLASGYRPPDVEINSAKFERGDDKHWKLGLFYYNPSDPAILVEDRFGTNIGFNYARTVAKIVVAVIALGTIATYIFTTIVIFPIL
jgi:uncharacterized membrane protein